MPSEAPHLPPEPGSLQTPEGGTRQRLIKRPLPAPGGMKHLTFIISLNCPLRALRVLLASRSSWSLTSLCPATPHSTSTYTELSGNWQCDSQGQCSW